MNKSKKIAIIGGGMAGLAAGTLLAKKGYQVQIFEARDKVGGCGTTTQIQGYTFSDGALWLVMLGLLDKAFQRIGLDRAALLPVRKIEANMTMRLPNGAAVTIHDGHQIRLERPSGPVDTTRLQQELDRFLRRWEPAFRPFINDLLLHPFSFWRMLRKAGWHLPKLRNSVAVELERLFSAEEMRAALSGALLYTGLVPDKMPAAQLMALVILFTEGYYLPEGGIGRLGDVLGSAFEKQGGAIALNTQVKRIIVKNGVVGGLELADGGIVEADAVLSTLSGMQTFLGLLDAGEAPARMLDKARNARLSVTTFVNVQLGLANQIDVPSHLNYLMPLMDEQHRFIHPQPQDEGILFYAVPTVTLPELAPAGGSVVEIFVPTPQELPLAAWDEERKEEMAAAAVETVARRHTLDIAVRRVRSPQDYQSQIYLYQGKIYGLSPAINPNGYFPHQTAVPGLYLAGQTTYPGYGLVPATISGILAAESMLRS